MNRVAILVALFWLAAFPVIVRADAPTIHTVAWGETLYSIARTYGITPQAIANANGITLNQLLVVGMRLKIPTSNAPTAPATTPSGYYTVRAGDTLFSIASRFNTTVAAISSANNLPANGLIYAGWSLKIPQPGANAPTVFTASARSHIVQPGENLFQIGLKYEITPQAIAQANSLPNLWLLAVGQRLNIPGARGFAPAPVADANTIRVANIPLLKQKQTLTCEEASAAMASRGAFTEEQLVAVMPRSDNPFNGIRGQTNSPYFGGLTDYGVYAQGLQKGLSALGIKSQVLYGQEYDDFKNAILDHLRAGRAVIWWHSWQDSYQTPVLMKMSDGASIKMVPYEHASVIVAASDRGVTYHDPYDGTVRFVSWADHRRVSAYFDNMALVIMTNDK
ncbi:MAG: LysM peptidoglycan-binding domain-containing protein [Chloroflexi bacterium]|nr:LysM peptidoglycan-binding domain-containing protein [Chloroflexota bacterium]